MKNTNNAEITFKNTDARVLVKVYDFHNDIRMCSMDFANIIDYETPKERFLNDKFGVEIVLRYINDLSKNLNIMKKELNDKKKELKAIKQVPKIESVKPNYIG